MLLATQVAWLFLLAIPIACVAWTVTHEEILREAREYCLTQSQRNRSWIKRKFFYMLTCEFCFSHYVSAFFLLITRYTLLLPDWRGYLIAWFSLVWVANQYMGVFNRLRLGIKGESVDIKVKEEQLENGTS